MDREMLAARVIVRTMRACDAAAHEQILSHES
jgi:hypothetical protein